MRITCRECRSEFDLPPVPPGSGGSGSCPFCKAKFKLTDTGERGVRQVVFVTDETPNRVCINCSKEFAADPGEAIPICPSCRGETEKKETTPVPRIWKIFRKTGTLELDSEQAIREWIRAGDIHPDDKILAPSGKMASGKRFPQFAEAFRAQHERQTSPGAGTSPAARLRRWLRFSNLLRSLLILVMALALTWTMYRIVTYHGSTAATDPTLAKLVTELRQRSDPLGKPPNELFQSAMELLASDRPENYETARTQLEQALTLNPESGPVLQFLAIAYAFTAAHGTDQDVRLVAMDLSDLAIRLYPNDAGGYVAKTRAALSANNLEAAEAASLKALSLSPNDPWVRLTRARALLAQGKLNETQNDVLAFASGVSKDQPDLLESYDILGELYLRTAQPDLAQIEFERRLKRNPVDPQALFRMGTVQERGGDYEGAREWYTQALRASTSIVSARLQIAILYHRIEGKLRLAERHLREILVRYSRFTLPEELFGAQRELVDILLETHREAEASDLSKQFAPSLVGTSSYVVTMASIWDSTGGSDRALSSLQDYLSTHPADPDVLLLTARLQAKRGATEEAKKTLRTLMTAKPDWLVPHLELIRLFVDKKRFDEALDVASAAISHPSYRLQSEYRESSLIPRRRMDWEPFVVASRALAKEKSESVIAQSMLGVALLAQNLETGSESSFKSGKAALERARSLDLTNEIPHLQLGRLLLNRKATTPAIAEFQAALKANPLSAPAHFWLGIAYIEAKKWIEAEKSLETIKENPDWAHRAVYELGRLENLRGDTTKARDYWHASLNLDPSYIPAWRALLH